MVSTRRGATAASDSDQPAQSAQERRGTQAASSRGASAEPRKRSTRRKASDTPQQVQPAEEASTALTTTTQNTVTTATPKITASKRRTRSTKQADSPLQTLPTTERATRKQARKQIASATAGLEQQPEVQPQQQPVEEPVQEPVQKQKQERTPEATQENARELAQDDGENQGIFFTDHMLQENVDLQLENSRLKDENSQLKEEIDIRHEERTQMRDRIVELTTNGVHLEAQYHHLEVERDRYKDENDALMEREFDKRAVLNANDNLKSQCDKLRAFLQESQALLKEYQPSKHFADQCLAEFARYRINHMPPVEAFEHATKAGNSASSLQILHRVDAVRMALKKGALSPAHLEKIYGGAIPVDAINADYEPSPTEPIAVDPPAAENATAQIVAAEPLPEATTEPVAAPATPAAPTSFFGRALSAIKSPFAYFTAPTHAVPAPASPTPRAAPPEPESLTEVLTQTPTPVGERVRAKKKPRNPMLKALTKGLKPDEMREAEAWAKQVVAQLKNDPHKGEKRKRLEAPVLLKDLNSLPSRKPWEGGFGDPLADYDDDDVVPAWAVYADMMDEEEHKTKKHKSHHEVTMDDELPSPNESLASPSHKTVDTHGNSASLQDLHPRSARVPSPMFDNPLIHQEGGNVFKELQGGASAKQTHATDRASMLQRNEAVPHNPSHGSFSAPDPFAEDDSDISEVADADQENAPLWTQPPPAAPVPAHASLPAQRDEQTATTSSQPVDEVERQRAKLMKHTPAKPSRLREVKYPSPSVKSDAGNDSIFAATPSHMVAPSAADFKFNIPDPEPLEFDDPELAAAVRAHLESDEYKMMHANAYKGDVILTYDEEDETSDD